MSALGKAARMTGQAAPKKKGPLGPVWLPGRRLLFGLRFKHLVQLLNARQDLELVERVTDPDLLQNPGAGQDEFAPALALLALIKALVLGVQGGEVRETIAKVAQGILKSAIGHVHRGSQELALIQRVKRFPYLKDTRGPGLRKGFCLKRRDFSNDYPGTSHPGGGERQPGARTSQDGPGRAGGADR